MDLQGDYGRTLEQQEDDPLERMKTQLEEMQARINALQAELGEVEAEAKKADYQRLLEALRARQQVANEKIAELGRAGRDVLGDLRSGFENAWKDVKIAMQNARERVLQRNRSA